MPKRELITELAIVEVFQRWKKLFRHHYLSAVRPVVKKFTCQFNRLFLKGPVLGKA